VTKDVIWRWRDACIALGLTPVDGPDITGISIDTRTLEPGDLFVALSGDPGPRFHTDSRSDRDGHAYIAEAQRRGAVGAMTDRATNTSLPELRVGNTLDGLWALGRAARRRLSAPVFAVTGSSGKTTVRAFLAAALGVPPAAGSLNNFWGVPLSLARTPPSASAAVFEIGTNHPGEIEPLAQLVSPTVALVLNVRPAHLQFFASLGELRREKLSIFAGLAAHGVAVLPDDLDAPELPRNLRVVRFGRSASADVQLYAYRPADRIATYRVHGREYSARVPGGGMHRATSLASVLACLTAGGRPIASALDLPDEVVPAGRGSRVDVGGVHIIDDSYNANPASMAAALTGLAMEAAHRSIAILGEMRELGQGSATYHRELGAHCAGIAQIVCVGAGMDALWETLPPAQRLLRAADVDALSLPDLVAQISPGDVVLIKGSNRVFWQHQFVERFTRALEQRFGVVRAES
jgi:UDP-N-acetylmuramoyl-tripeptide--D-alanyl-D-alanine ligase